MTCEQARRTVCPQRELRGGTYSGSIKVENEGRRRREREITRATPKLLKMRTIGARCGLVYEGFEGFFDSDGVLESCPQYALSSLTLSSLSGEIRDANNPP